MNTRINLLFTATLALLLGFAGCKKDENEAVGPESQSAVLISLMKQDPGGRQYYMGVYPSVSTTAPETNKMIELGSSVKAEAYNGFVYVFNWEGSTISKWEVDAKLNLNKVSTLSFANTGITYSPTCFASETKAYLFDLVNGKIIEWNPKEMTLTETIKVTPTAFSYSNPDQPKVFGNTILLSVSNVNYIGAGTLEDKTTVALYDMATKSLQYKSINRGVTTFQNIMTSTGKVYFAPIREQHYSILYDPTNKDIKNFGEMVRFDMNTKQFDESYVLDLEKVVGGVVSQAFLLNDNEMLVETIQQPLPAYTNESNYFGAVRAKLRKVNLTTNAVSDYNSIGENDLTWTNNLNFKVDDAFYFLPAEFPDKGPEYYKTINTKVYKVSSDAAQLAFSMPNTVIHTIQKVR